MGETGTVVAGVGRAAGLRVLVGHAMPCKSRWGCRVGTRVFWRTPSGGVAGGERTDESPAEKWAPSSKAGGGGEAVADSR